MIIKGSARGQNAADTMLLARHLLSNENESVAIIGAKGLVASGLPAALQEMRALTLGTRARRGLYHASINLHRDDTSAMTTCRWMESVDELERRLGLSGHQRVIVQHTKRGREHVHIVWCRAHPATLKIARDSQNYRVHEEAARSLEARWSLSPVLGVHTRPRGIRRPVAVATHNDWQVAERTGINAVDVADHLQQAWAETRTGKQFVTVIAQNGFCLARGRRGIVIIDTAGTPHSIARRLKIDAAAVRNRLADIDMNGLPSVEDIQAHRKRGTTYRRKIDMNRKKKSFCAIVKQSGTNARSPNVADNYWRNLGYFVEHVHDELLIVTLPSGPNLHDQGSKLTLLCDNEPSDEDIRILVAAGKARGWQTIHFFGSAEFQRRAQIEALKQGYLPSQISLQRDAKAMPIDIAQHDLPRHIYRRFHTPPTDTPMPVAPFDPAQPDNEMRL